MSKSKKTNKLIDKLTPEQEAKIPQYIEKFLAIGLNTTPCDRAKAEESITKCLDYFKKKPTKFVWVDSPYVGVELAAQTHFKTDKPSVEQIKEMSNYSFYGSFESYWVAFYDFVVNELPVEKHPLVDIVIDVVKNCGVHWALEDGTVIISEKPISVHFKDNKLHNPNGLALEYKDGTGIFSLNGVRYPSLMEMTIQNEANNVGEVSV